VCIIRAYVYRRCGARAGGRAATWRRGGCVGAVVAVQKAIGTDTYIHIYVCMYVAVAGDVRIWGSQSPMCEFGVWGSATPFIAWSCFEPCV
jgi:hypothetical protein